MPNDKNKQSTDQITADEILGKLKKKVNMKESDFAENPDDGEFSKSGSGDELEIKIENLSAIGARRQYVKPESSGKNRTDTQRQGVSASDTLPPPQIYDNTERPYEDDSELDMEALLKKYLPDHAKSSEKDKQVQQNQKKSFSGTAAKVDTSDIPLSRIGKAPVQEYTPGEKTDKAEKGKLFDFKNDSEEDSVLSEKYTEDSEFELDDEPIQDPFADEYEKASKKKPLFSFSGKNKKSGKQTIEDPVIQKQERGKKKEEIEASGFGRDVTSETDENPAGAGEDLYELAPPDIKMYDDAALEEEFSENDSGLDTKKTQEVDKKQIDKSDINLMVALGLEEQLGSTVGVDKVTELEEELQEKSSRVKKYVNDEYIDRSQTKKIADAYKYAHISTKIKLAVAIVMALGLLVYENIGLTGMQFGGFNDPAVYPVVYIMIDLQVLLLCAAMAYNEIFSGFKALFTGKPMPESITAVMVVFAIVHSTMESLMVISPVEPHLYNFPVALCVVMTLIYTLYNIKREIFSFNVISAKRPKFALSKLTATQSRAEAESFKDVIDDGPDILKIEKASFIDGYFTRTNQTAPYTPVIAAIIPIIFAIAIVFFVMSYNATKSIITASTLSYITLLFGYPVSMFFTYSYPFYKANREAYENDSTIIGEASIEEYADASIISFDDKNVFPSYGVKISNMYIFDNNRIDRVLYYAASVFAKAGGPLADVFDVATIEMERSEDVKILSSETGLLEALVDGKSIMLGSKHALEGIGIDIPDEISEDDKLADSDICVMYLAKNGELIAKMFIKYIIDSDFEFILRQLSGSGMCVGIKTFDPNIDEEMIGRMVKLKKYPLKVLRNTIADEHAQSNEHIDSGIVSRGTTKSLLQTVSYCDKVLHVRKTNLIIKILAMSVGMIIVWLLGMYSGTDSLRSMYIAVYQLFWLIPMMITSKIFI